MSKSNNCFVDPRRACAARVTGGPDGDFAETTAFERTNWHGRGQRCVAQPNPSISGAHACIRLAHLDLIRLLCVHRSTRSNEGCVSTPACTVANQCQKLLAGDRK